ncbi:hypothetical protein EJ04DRAFT_97535 [Polyplosphaeria fusca]|uniref:Uncharacterized protein n=1 Tax=Polyplosphaeria fusca TaxID=682080 RepID=A0A9P4UVP6_9PLEO|nr:hypothetical protein EJ04DRAFT_97535 [Polyplosphaeria fusca]
MSGNPFRASLHQTPAAASATTAPPTSFIDPDNKRADEFSALENDSVSAPPLPVKTKKSVRIESPTSSPPHPAFDDAGSVLAQRISRARRPGSPSLISPTKSDFVTKSELRGRESDSSDDDEGPQDIAGSVRRSSDMRDSVQSPSGAPANPFSKTLATIEPHEKGSAERARAAGQSKDRSTLDKQSSRASQALDVEGFKKLLMTGISSPANPGGTAQTATATAPAPGVPSIFESSSSTDTSSISRQSIFEPIQETHVETPRTSYEMAPSDDEERSSLIGGGKKTEKKKAPPPAPKHRHGKLVASRTPQTVSFSDFAPSFISEPTSPPSPSQTRADSNLNKPLPPPPILEPPAAHIVSQDKSFDEPSSTEAKDKQPSTLPDPLPLPKKQPPPVPLARRQSQLRSITANRSRSNSSLTLSSQVSSDLPLSSPNILTEPTSHPQAHKSPPPPPPSRRHGATPISLNTPSANSSTTELPNSSQRSTSSLPEPPQSSSRRSTVSSPPPSPAPGLALSRTASITSNRNPRSVSNESATMPPPPPPPRRRQSGRTSIDKERPFLPSSSPNESRRTSLENKRSSFEGRRRTSVASESSLRHEYAPTSDQEQALYSPKEENEEPRSLEPAESSSANILDDMERFQKEIEELRERYKQAS